MASVDFLFDLDDTHSVDDTTSAEVHERTMESLSRHARKQPGLWACSACELLHELDEQDIPLAPGMDAAYGRAHAENTAGGAAACGMAACAARRATGAHPSGIRHHHVQLALKLTRLARAGRPCHPSYLQRLTGAYAIADVQTMARTDRLDPAPRRDGLPNAFTPKVARDADGCLRFLLQTTYQLAPDAAGAPARTITACPHMQIRAAAAAVAARSGRCQHCATTYVVTGGGGGGDQVRVFEDLGTEGSPADLAWRAHLEAAVQNQGRARVRFGSKRHGMEAVFGADAPNESHLSEDKTAKMRSKLHALGSRMKGGLKLALSLDF